MFGCESVKTNHTYCKIRLVQVRLISQGRKTQHGATCASEKAMGIRLGTELCLAQVLLVSCPSLLLLCLLLVGTVEQSGAF